MRISIDGRLWNETGVGRYIRSLVKYLQIFDKSNDYVLFVRGEDYESIKYQVLSIKWKIVRTDIHWHTLREQLFLPWVFYKEKLDLVHFPYFSVPIFYPGKFIVTIHDLIPFHFDTGLATTLPTPFYKLKRFGYKCVIKMAAKRATKIITVSDTTKDEITKHLDVDPSKVIVTYEGASLGDSKKHSTLYPNPYFLYVGNAYPHKNLERLLQALNILISQYPNIQLVLVGKEDYFYKKLKEKVKKMGLVNNVIFYGEANDEELLGLYKNAKALILPSLMEGFGLPALEAMANRCLVLASDITAIREVCGKAAIYFNPYDVDEMTARLKTVIEQSNKETLARAVLRAKHFSWEKMARETLKVYQSI